MPHGAAPEAPSIAAIDVATYHSAYKWLVSLRTFSPLLHMSQQYLITAALPYANGYLHLGHIAGAYLPADLYARFLRLAGERVLFVCGSDEHGVAITIRAEQEGKTPKEIVDHYHAANRDAFDEFGMTFDVYGRTSSPEHHRLAQEWFLDFYNRGLLEERQELQFYDEQAGMFLPDRYVEGTCPNCGYERARGDQCEQCGAYYNQLELKHPRSLISGQPPAVRPTTHWYFRLSQFQQALEDYITAHQKDWKENVYRQALAWLKQGLSDRAITRDLRWGVPVPLPNAEGKVLYVWFEALLGYISATHQWAHQQGDPDAWRSWWLSSPDHQTYYAAFIGKDNIVFHTLMFPAMLMARGGYILPANVPANEFLNLEGQKFSKSRNWSIDLRDALADFPHPHHRDALRYAIAMNFPETRDADFTWSDFQARTNNELAAIVGNYANRVLAFIARNFDGRVPMLDAADADLPEQWQSAVMAALNASGSTPTALADLAAQYSDEERALIEALVTGSAAIANAYRSFRFRDAIGETINLARAANKFFNDAAPWKTLSEQPARCRRTMFVCMQALRAISIALAPVAPNLSARLQRACGIAQPTTGQPSGGNAGPNVWATIPLPTVAQGTPTGTPERFIEPITDEQIAAQRAKLGTSTASPEPTPSDRITIDDFGRIELRTGRVLAAERVPKSQKLIKLIVDIGTEQRQIVAGIGKHYTPEELIGTDVVVVTNLQPARLMGIESNGMLLAANSDDQLVVITPRTRVPPGSVVR